MTVAEAAAKGDVVRLRTLLENGGDPNEPETEKYMSPLLEAAYADHTEAVRLLLDAGADMYATLWRGMPVLGIAIEQKSLDVFRLLMEHGYRLDVAQDGVGDMLSRAATHGLLEVVEWMLAQGVDVDAVDMMHGTALTAAAFSHQLEVMQTLLRAGANPSHGDYDTVTVLMWAADRAGNAAVLRSLIAAGAEVNTRNDIGYTALTYAVRHGDPEMVLALLEGGSVILPYDLTLASYNGFAPAVRLLLAWGAKAMTEDLERARSRGHWDVVSLLHQAMEDQRLH